MISRMVIFGATGDLTARLLLPAVAQLVESNALPSDIQILGSAVESWSVEKFRKHIAQALDAHAAQVVADHATASGQYARLPPVGRNRSNRRCGRHRHGPWVERSSTWPCPPVCWRLR